MGRVLLGYDPQIDRKVAIKVVQGVVPESPEARERFLAEARSAGRLLHPGIVALFDAGEADGVPYLAMEYVAGDPLDRFCTPDALLPVPVVVDLVARAAEALAYAHRCGIVHRDIKPANLMRVADSAVKVMDFGLAGGAEAGLGSPGVILGSPSYLSPEQVRGATIDGRGDLFALAVVLYELLAGEKPFPGDSVSAVVYRIVNEAPREPPPGHPRFSHELRAFLRTALAKSPDERFGDGSEFALALRRAASALAMPQPAVARSESAEALLAASIPPTPGRAPRSSATPYILGGFAVAALFGGGAWAFRDKLFGPPPPPPVEMLEARLRSEPPEARVLLDGVPLDSAATGTVRFAAAGPFGLLRAEHACRSDEHRLGPADAGAEIALVLEPVELAYALDGLPASAEVQLNGAAIGKTPLDLHLDLCRANRIALAASGYRPATVEIPEGATPLEARNRLGTIALEAIPKGILVLPESSIRVAFEVDGKAVEASARRLELPEGPHEVRVRNDEHWIDITATVEVVADAEVRPALEIPRLSRLVVLAYPPNCTVDVRRAGGDWKYLGDVPLRQKIAVGTYQVRVTLRPTGQSETREVRLAAGDAPEIRVSFRG